MSRPERTRCWIGQSRISFQASLLKRSPPIQIRLLIMTVSTRLVALALDLAASAWILAGPLYVVHEVRTLDDHKSNIEREYKISGLQSRESKTFLLWSSLPV